MALPLKNTTGDVLANHGDCVDGSSWLYDEYAAGAFTSASNQLEDDYLQQGEFMMGGGDDSDGEGMDDVALFYAGSENDDVFDPDAESDDEADDEMMAAMMTTNQWSQGERGRGYSWDIEVQNGNYVSSSGQDNFLSMVFDIKALQKVADDQVAAEEAAKNREKAAHLAAQLAARQLVEAGEGKKAEAGSSSSMEPGIVSTPYTGEHSSKPMRGGYLPLPMPAQFPEGKVGDYTYAERRAIIEKFREKKRNRIWKKQIKYVCRKKLAETRPRIKGRFVSRVEDEPATGEDGAGADFEPVGNLDLDGDAAILAANDVSKNLDSSFLGASASALDAVEPPITPLLSPGTAATGCESGETASSSTVAKETAQVSSPAPEDSALL